METFIKRIKMSPFYKYILIINYNGQVNELCSKLS